MIIFVESVYLCLIFLDFLFISVCKSVVMWSADTCDGMVWFHGSVRCKICVRLTPYFSVVLVVHILMGNDTNSWRMSIGLFYTKAYGCITGHKTGKLVFSFLTVMTLLQSFGINTFLFLKSLLPFLSYLNLLMVISLLITLAGDVESNPGPSNAEHSVSLLHHSSRSIRNKIEYIIDNFLDFDILCFTETHLDNNILTDNLILDIKYDKPYRKDRTNHGGGI